MRPPRRPERPPDPSQVSRARLAAIGLAIAVDLVILAVMRDPALFHLPVLYGFLAINVTLLLVDGAITLATARKPVPTVCALIEAFTIVVFIQITGTVSSYFIVAGPILVLMYRFFLGYRAGLAMCAGMVVFHVGAYVLESMHVLRIAALFVRDPGGIYATPAYRFAAMTSILSLYAITFGCANWMLVALAEKDAALSDVRGDLERAVAERKPGRLSGVTLEGRYRLAEVLGRGGMGEVYEAVQLADGARVAIKILYGHLAGEATAVERFRREADAARKLSKEHVAPIHAVGTTEDGAPYLVMDLLHGEDLGALLRRRQRLVRDEILPIVDALAAALDAAHDANIVHRDVKPPNVFLVEGGGVRLLDFGVARLGEASALTHTSALVGTPGYLAPEQINGAPSDIGPHTDLFALGAIVYRALTGQPAFASRQASAALYEAVHVDPRAPSRIAPNLNADVDFVIALALAKRPADRYARASLFARDLRAAFDGALSAEVRARSAAVTPSHDAATLETTVASVTT